MNPEKKSSLRIGDMNFKHQEQGIEHEDQLKNPPRFSGRISQETKTFAEKKPKS